MNEQSFNDYPTNSQNQNPAKGNAKSKSSLRSNLMSAKKVGGGMVVVNFNEEHNNNIDSIV